MLGVLDYQGSDVGDRVADMMLGICMVLVACTSAYTLWLVLKVIPVQLKFNDVTIETLSDIAKWVDEIDNKQDEFELRVNNAEVLAGNASNKATANSRKIERLSGHDIG